MLTAMSQGRKRKQVTTLGSAVKRNPNSCPKPLSYESLKAVLEHLEANKRLDVVRRCDSIQTADKAAPLKIEKLEFKPMKTIINNRTYQLGVYRKFKDRGDNQIYKLDGTCSGGAPYDLDRFGFRETSEDMKMTLGDVKLLFERLPDKPTLDQSRRHIKSETNFIDRFKPSEVRRMKGKLLPSICHVEGRTPPYNSFILFTMNTANFWDSEKKEYIEYTKSLREASKHLNAQIFGGQSCPIQVRKMKVESGKTTLRLPRDVKIRVQIIEIDEYLSRSIEKLSQILTDSSFPLKTIETTYTNDTGDLKHQNILEAKKFVVLEDLSWGHFGDDTNWSLFPSGTHFVKCRDYLSIIKHWQANEPAVGTFFSVKFSTSGRTQQEISDDIGGVINEGIIVVALNDTRNIEVTYEEVDKNKYDSYGASHILNMKVVGK